MRALKVTCLCKTCPFRLLSGSSDFFPLPGDLLAQSHFLRNFLRDTPEDRVKVYLYEKRHMCLDRCLKANVPEIFVVFRHITVEFLFSSVASRRPASASAASIASAAHSSSHTSHVTHNNTQTQAYTHLISQHSSHTSHLTHNSYQTTHLTHNSSHTSNLTHIISHISSHSRVAWQAQ